MRHFMWGSIITFSLISFWTYNGCCGTEGTFYIFTGKSVHLPTDIALHLNNKYYDLSNTHFSSRSFQLPLYYGISAGWALRIKNAPIRFSLEFIHDKAYAQTNRSVFVKNSTNPKIPAHHSTPLNKIIDAFSMSHGFNFILLNVHYPLYKNRFLQKIFSVNMGLGGGLMLPHVESRIGNQAQEKYEWKGPAVKLDVLAMYSISETWMVLAGIKYSIARIKNARIFAGNVSTTISSFHFVTGIGFKIQSLF